MTPKPPPTKSEMREQMEKAGRYFRRGLREHKGKHVAACFSDEQGQVLVLVATDGIAVKTIEVLAAAGLLDPDLPDFKQPYVEAEPSAPPEPARVFEPGVGDVGAGRRDGGASQFPRPTMQEIGASPALPVALERRYHEPGDSKYAKEGHVHLHVTADTTLGRRTRKAGESLCSKKHGSRERPPTTAETTFCPECVSVAAREGLEF